VVVVVLIDTLHARAGVQCDKPHGPFCSEENLLLFCKQHELHSFYYTSAKFNLHITDFFEAGVFPVLIENATRITNPQPQVSHVDLADAIDHSSFECCNT
jgi:hypothetical protein